MNVYSGIVELRLPVMSDAHRAPVWCVLIPWVNLRIVNIGLAFIPQGTATTSFLATFQHPCNAARNVENGFLLFLTLMLA